MEGFRSYSAEDSRKNSPKPKKGRNVNKKIKQQPKENNNDYTIKPYLYGAGLGVVATKAAPYIKEASEYLWDKYQVGPRIYRVGNQMRNRFKHRLITLKNQFNKGARFIGNKIADGLMSASNYIRPSNISATPLNHTVVSNTTALSTPTPTPTPLPNTDAIGHN